MSSEVTSSSSSDFDLEPNEDGSHGDGRVNTHPITAAAVAQSLHMRGAMRPPETSSSSSSSSSEKESSLNLEEGEGGEGEESSSGGGSLDLDTSFDERGEDEDTDEEREHDEESTDGTETSRVDRPSHGLAPLPVSTAPLPALEVAIEAPLPPTAIASSPALSPERCDNEPISKGPNEERNASSILAFGKGSRSVNSNAHNNSSSAPFNISGSHHRVPISAAAAPAAIDEDRFVIGSSTSVTATSPTATQPDIKTADESDDEDEDDDAAETADTAAEEATVSNRSGGVGIATRKQGASPPVLPSSAAGRLLSPSQPKRHSQQRATIAVANQPFLMSGRAAPRRISAQPHSKTNASDSGMLESVEDEDATRLSTDLSTIESPSHHHHTRSSNPSSPLAQPDKRNGNDEDKTPASSSSNAADGNTFSVRSATEDQPTPKDSNRMAVASSDAPSESAAAPRETAKQNPVETATVFTTNEIAVDNVVAGSPSVEPSAVTSASEEIVVSHVNRKDDLVAGGGEVVASAADTAKSSTPTDSHKETDASFDRHNRKDQIDDSFFSQLNAKDDKRNGSMAEWLEDGDEDEAKRRNRQLSMLLTTENASADQSPSESAQQIEEAPNASTAPESADAHEGNHKVSPKSPSPDHVSNADKIDNEDEFEKESEPESTCYSPLQPSDRPTQAGEVKPGRDGPIILNDAKPSSSPPPVPATALAEPSPSSALLDDQKKGKSASPDEKTTSDASSSSSAVATAAEDSFEDASEESSPSAAAHRKEEIQVSPLRAVDSSADTDEATAKHTPPPAEGGEGRGVLLGDYEGGVYEDDFSSHASSSSPSSRRSSNRSQHRRSGSSRSPSSSSSNSDGASNHGPRPLLLKDTLVGAKASDDKKKRVDTGVSSSSPKPTRPRGEKDLATKKGCTTVAIINNLGTDQCQRHEQHQPHTQEQPSVNASLSKRAADARRHVHAGYKQFVRLSHAAQLLLMDAVTACDEAVAAEETHAKEVRRKRLEHAESARARSRGEAPSAAHDGASVVDDEGHYHNGQQKQQQLSTRNAVVPISPAASSRPATATARVACPPHRRSSQQTASRPSSAAPRGPVSASYTRQTSSLNMSLETPHQQPLVGAAADEEHHPHHHNSPPQLRRTVSSCAVGMEALFAYAYVDGGAMPSPANHHSDHAHPIQSPKHGDATQCPQKPVSSRPVSARRPHSDAKEPNGSRPPTAGRSRNSLAAPQSRPSTASSSRECAPPPTATHATGEGRSVMVVDAMGSQENPQTQGKQETMAQRVARLAVPKGQGQRPQSAASSSARHRSESQVSAAPSAASHNRVAVSSCSTSLYPMQGPSAGRRLAYEAAAREMGIMCDEAEKDEKTEDRASHNQKKRSEVHSAEPAQHAAGDSAPKETRKVFHEDHTARLAIPKPPSQPPPNELRRNATKLNATQQQAMNERLYTQGQARQANALAIVAKREREREAKLLEHRSVVKQQHKSKEDEPSPTPESIAERLHDQDTERRARNREALLRKEMTMTRGGESKGLKRANSATPSPRAPSTDGSSKDAAGDRVASIVQRQYADALAHRQQAREELIATYTDGKRPKSAASRKVSKADWDAIVNRNYADPFGKMAH